MSEKKAAQIEEEEKEQEKMWNFFLEIWDSTPPSERKCYETGRPLVGVPLTVYFHHVLPKHLYPEYKYCKWNVVLLTWLVHDQAEIDIDKTPKVKALYEHLLESHTKIRET